MERQSQGRAERWATLQLQPARQTKQVIGAAGQARCYFSVKQSETEAGSDRDWVHCGLSERPFQDVLIPRVGGQGQTTALPENAYCEWVKEGAAARLSKTIERN